MASKLSKQTAAIKEPQRLHDRVKQDIKPIEAFNKVGEENRSGSVKQG